MMQKYISFFSTILIILLVNFSIFSQNAEFTSDKTQGCDNLPLAVNFTNQSTGSNLTYIWNFGDGSPTSNLLNPNHTYQTPGIYTVTLICSNGTTSDTIIKVGYIKYYKSPTADFTQDKTQGCNPLAVNFTNLSTLGDTSLSSITWTFGDAQSSTVYSPSHVYSNPGNYSVSLFLTDYHSCTSSKTPAYKINVTQNNINASFTINKPIGCDTPHTVTLTNTTIDTTLTYNWYFGDNSTSNVYAPSPHTYFNFGTYPISLVVNGTGCKDSISKNVSINSFVGNFKIDTTAGCKPFSAHFTNLTTGSSFWKWNFGDGSTTTWQNPVHTFDTSGTYNIQLIVGNASCSDTIIKPINIIVYPKPVISFYATDSTACSIPFNAQFTQTGDQAASWSWTFTGGTPSSSTDPNPLITYNDTLDYSVSLTVVDSNNCSVSHSKNNYIKINLPHANYTFDTLKGCIPLSVNFTDLSTSVENISHWYWDFGDGSPIIDLQNPAHTFTDTGSYSVKLIIENIKGCVDTIIFKDTVLVGDHKNVLFSPSDSAGCYKFILPFTDLSDSVADEWAWDFGDGGISTQQNPTHTYADTGYFNVSLTVGFHGCYDTFSLDSVAQVYPPIAKFTPSTLVACDTPLVVSFFDESVLADSWEWHFDTISTFTGQTPTDVTFLTQGFYDIKLVVGNSTFGCFDSITKTIKISDIHVNFHPDTTKGCMPFTCNFNDDSWVNTAITLWHWTYGDGNTFDTTITTSTNTYLNYGFYNVNLEITDQLGCKESLNIDSLVEVKGLPFPGFVADVVTGCVPLTVNFIDTTNFNVPPKSWLWSFGDNTTSNDTNASHIFSPRGAYNISLTITDTNNCVGTYTNSNYIIATFPYPGFSFDTIACNSQNVSFSGASSTSTSEAIGDTLMFEWNFGDNSPISTLANPNHTFSTNADTAVSFNVSLKVTDRNGCDSTISKKITISDIRAGFYADGTVATCPDFFVHFTDSSKSTLGNLTSWLWDFGNNAPLIDTIDDPYNTYTESGIYDVQLIVGNNYGCYDTLKIDSMIKVQGPKGTLTYDIDTSKCTPVFTFHVTTDNAVSYFWDFDDETSSENYVNTIEHVYLISETFDPLVIFKDANDCPGSAKLDNPIVVDFPYVPVTLSSTPAICTTASGSATVVANGTKPPFSYLWSNNDTLSTANNLMFGDYIVTVTDSIGCLGGGLVTVGQTLISFQNTFNKTNEICTGANGTALSIPSSGTSPYTFNWNNNYTSDNVGNLAQGTYYVTITDLNGCVKVDSVTIGRDFISYLSNITKKDIMCKDKSGIVSVSPDGTSPFTYSWNTGNYSSSILNLDTGKYTVTIIDALGCIITDSATVDLLTNVTINASYITDTNNVLAITPILFTSTSYDSIPITTYTWDIDNKTFSDTIGILNYKFEDAGLYDVMLKIIDEYGCIDSFTTTITIRDGLEVPNVFSPNGDGENDVFYLHHSGIEQFRIDIFNRWGVLMFAETAPKVYWTGKTTAGVDVPDGVYFYIIEATSVLGEVYKLQGTISLFR